MKKNLKFMVFFLVVILSLCFFYTKSFATTENNPTISYVAHGAGYGWQSYVNSGEIAGTIGESKRMEAIKIKLVNVPKDAEIIYQVHGADYGWQSWKKNDDLGGSTGKSLRMEAIRIKLINLEGYKVQYRAHVAGYGWLKWVEDGELAGTVGESRRIEAIQVKLIKIDNTQDKEDEENKEDNNEKEDEENKDDKKLQATYVAQGQDYGWQSWVKDGELAGTTGQSRRMEGIKIKLVNAPENAKILYQVHGASYGWQTAVSDGALGGTDGKSLRIEAIKIQLVNLDDYSVQYRVHGEGYGWQDWVYDGEIAGTVGQSKRVEAIEIKIVPKVNIGKVVLEQPVRNILTDSKIDISGYGVSTFGKNTINLYIDGKKVVDTQRVERKDLESIYKQNFTNLETIYGNSTVNNVPGFKTTVDLSKYESGLHKIKVDLYAEDCKTLLSTTSKEFTYYTDRNYGIDVSKYQKDIDWTQVKNSNVDFAMIRVGLRGYGTGKIVVDSKYEYNITNATKNGIKCGVYFFSQAINAQEGIEEAKWVLEQVKGKDIKYPIAIDVEWSNGNKDGRADNISVADRTSATKAFCETIKEAGYVPVIYANKEWLQYYLNLSELSEFDVWLAHYVVGAPEKNTDYSGNYTMWQYTSQGSCYGINGNVDQNISYKKYY